MPGLPAPSPKTLVLTDVVDSTRLAERLGDARVAALWAAHDRLARDLLAAHGGREIDKTDGMLLLFDEPGPAVAFAVAYHRGLAELSAAEEQRLAARVGLHHAEVLLRENEAADVARGAKPLEVEGLAKPLTARVMSLASGGQSLVTTAALEALRELPEGLESRLHGHYRLKGVEEPVALHEIGAPGEAPFLPPADAAKAYRVVESAGAWVPVADIPTNLPTERDAFFGREAELRELSQRLSGGERLVTLLGPGGTGKSRLSVEFARRWRGDWPGGTWSCELEEAATAAELVATVARVAGIALEGGDPVEWVGAVLAEREPSLFLLDNFEQLAEHAPVIVRWMERAPGTAFLVTSRERLHVHGEQVLRLEALRVPEEGSSTRELLENEAVQLFATRARAAAPRFVVDERNAEAVASLVRLLDGMPLAIELAAARAPVMSPDKMVQRMGDRFRLLAFSKRGVKERQATLRGAIDWSWENAEPWERLALAQCSVFRGGFTLEAAESVLELSAWPEAPWVVDVVQGLVDKSLLRTIRPPGGERFDLEEPLLGMYQSIRDYADEKMRDPAGVELPSGEAVTGPDPHRELRRRHARHYGDRFEERFESRKTREGAAALLADRDNLLAALEAALALDEPEPAVDCWSLLATLAFIHGPAAETMQHFDRLPLDRVDDDRRLMAIDRQLDLCRQDGISRDDLLHEVVNHWAARGDEERELMARIRQVVLRERNIYRDPEQARADLEFLGPRVEALDHPRVSCHWLSNLALVAEPEEALDLWKRAASADPPGRGAALYNWGLLHLSREEHDEALARADEVEAWAADRPDRPLFETFVATLRGQVLARRGDWDEAERWLRTARRLAQQQGNRRFVFGGNTQTLARKHLRDGDVTAARELVDASLPMLRLLGDPNEIAQGLSTLAELRLAEGDIAAARAAIDEADTLAPELERQAAHLAGWLRDTRRAVEGAEADAE